MHVENDSLIRRDGGIAKLIIHPHVVKLHHRLIAHGWTGERLIVVALKIVDGHLRDGTQQ